MYELSINKRYKAPVERVFAVWSSVDQVKRWFAPGDMTVPDAHVDFRVGGTYRIVMQEPDGSQHIVGGVYREIVPNQRLCFTWRWEDSEVTTEVEINFCADGEYTDFGMTHRQFVTAEARDRHTQGWEACLTKLLKAV